MRRGLLPRSGLELTVLGFGGSQLGNLYRVTGEEEANGAVLAAWEAGVRYFDTVINVNCGIFAGRRINKSGTLCLGRH